MNTEVKVTLALITVPFATLAIIYFVAPFVRWLRLAIRVRRSEEHWSQRSEWLEENMPTDVPLAFREKYAEIRNFDPIRQRSTAELESDLRAYGYKDARLVSDALNRRLGRGQSMLEYAILIVLVAIIVLVILSLLGPSIGNLFSNVVSNV